MRANKSMWVVGMTASMASVCAVSGCEANRSPAAPNAVAAATVAPHVQANVAVRVVIDRGTFDLSQTDNTLAIFANERSNKFSWTGTVSEGLNPLTLQCPCAPGATVSIHTNWAGLSLAATTLTWGGVTYTNIGGLEENTGGQFQLVADIVMPPYRGQRTDRVRTTFTMSDTFFTVADPDSPLRLDLSGGGTATAWLTWRPVPLPPALPDGFWDITRVVYKFKHQ
jgi:hypothetical protein